MTIVIDIGAILRVIGWSIIVCFAYGAAVATFKAIFSIE